MAGPAPGADGEHRLSIAVYRRILRWYPRAFRDPWAEETVLLFAELARRRPRGAASTAALWVSHLPDLARGFVAEWSREIGRSSRRWNPAVPHGALAGALLSAATVAGNLGSLWQTPLGRAGSWLISAAALTVLARTGRVSVAGSGTIGRALRNGAVAGLIAFGAADLTATVIVLTSLDRLRRDPLQTAAFIASRESDFRTYQLHELLGGWVYGSAAGALLAAAGAGLAAAVSRSRRLGQRRAQR
ncbi:hypothetical protein [Dactylosporangium matsuzakiense]|uniref:Uncharacterized protein n=1 Tax=Dactylosporangium matsuzakiense TaxID=53360 RepID=A0A9W6KUK8_9ACTN|nr:hypothetical protein [Dactylosporangium matsuzakiense]UWZ41423.1 hypothetical protein Dmats_27565 [Dactylosporangium matsuzakiense]GLL06979.1 hypothetical protein GCM10017581_087300 [Dactylosporangium matsuzakiense]